MKKKSRAEQGEPSAASLEEMPEVKDLSRAKLNPHAGRIAVEGIELQIGPRRPEAGKEVGSTETRTVRFPPSVWRSVERTAQRKGLTLHEAMRLAIVQWVQNEASASAPKARRVVPRLQRRRAG